MKKILNFTLAMNLSFSVIGGVSAEGTTVNPIVVKVDNKQIAFPDGQPYITKGIPRVMVPVRFVSEAMGAIVEWDGITKTVKMSRKGTAISLKLGEKKALVNGERFLFDQAAVLKEGRTYVPLRFVSEVYGAKVNWLQKERTVLIENGQIQPIKDASGSKIPVNNKNQYFLSFHKSLVIKNGILTGTVPKPPNSDLFVGLEVRLKDASSKVMQRGGNFSFKARDVENMSFLVFDRNTGKVYADFGYTLPSLIPIDFSQKR